jgi:hypothetical protein
VRCLVGQSGGKWTSRTALIRFWDRERQRRCESRPHLVDQQRYGRGPCDQAEIDQKAGVWQGRFSTAAQAGASRLVSSPMAYAFLWKEEPFMLLAEEWHLERDMAAFQESRFPCLQHPADAVNGAQPTRSKARHDHVAIHSVPHRRAFSPHPCSTRSRRRAPARRLPFSHVFSRDRAEKGSPAPSSSFLLPIVSSAFSGPRASSPSRSDLSFFFVVLQQARTKPPKWPRAISPPKKGDQQRFLERKASVFVCNVSRRVYASIFSLGRDMRQKKDERAF